MTNGQSIVMVGLVAIFVGIFGFIAGNISAVSTEPTVISTPYKELAERAVTVGEKWMKRTELAMTQYNRCKEQLIKAETSENAD